MQAAARIVLDEGVWLRAVAVMPEGAVDVGDDLEGGYGGDVLGELMGLRREAGTRLQRIHPSRDAAQHTEVQLGMHARA